jgi:hypothetical protein
MPECIVIAHCKSERHTYDHGEHEATKCHGKARREMIDDRRAVGVNVRQLDRERFLRLL